MPSRRLEVEIVGDSRSLERAFGRSTTATGKLGRALGTGLKAAGIAAAAGLAVVGFGLKKSIDAAAEAEVSQKRLQAQLKALGISYKEHGSVIDETLQKQSALSAFDDEDLSDSFSNLVRVTGDVNKALDLNAIAMEVARGKGKDLEFGTMAVTKASMGQLGALKRQGIEIQAVTTAQDALGKKASDSAMEQAKAADLIATKQAALTLLQEKFAGQAEAFGNTAVGAQQRFGVALENLGEVIGGKVLPHLAPLLNGLTNFINKAAESEKLKQILQTVGQVIQGVLSALVTGFRVAADAAERYWPRVKAAAEAVANWYRSNLQPTMESVSRNISRAWERMGTDMQSSTRSHLTKLPPILSSQLGNVGSVVNAALALLRGDWSKAWEEIKEIPVRTFKAIVDTVRIYIGILRSVGEAVGRAVIDGIKGGISAAWGGLTGWIADKMADLKNAIMHPWNIGSPSKVTIEIGKQIAEGLGVGFGQGMVTVKEKAADKIREAIDAMVSAVGERRSLLASAFSTLASEALSAFDKLSSDLMTKTEKKIAAQDARRAAAERQAALTGAQAGLAEAVAGGDPAAILEAQKAVNEALFQIQRAADEKKAAQERLALDNKRALQRRHLEEEIAALQAQAEKIGMSHENLNRRIIAIFKKYEVPLKAATIRLGAALAEGLREAMQDAGRAAEELADTIRNRLGNISVVVRVHVASSGGPGEHRQHGGPVTAGKGYIVGEKGPEFFMPKTAGQIIPSGGGGGRMAGAGGMTVVVNAPNYVGDKRELMAVVQQGMVEWQRRNGGSFTGR